MFMVLNCSAHISVHVFNNHEKPEPHPVDSHNMCCHAWLVMFVLHVLLTIVHSNKLNLFSFSWIEWISCSIYVLWWAVVNLGSCNGGHDNHILWMYYEYMLHCCKYIVNFKIYIINMFWSFSFGDYRWQTFKTKLFHPLALPRHINVLFRSPLKAFAVM